MIPSDVAAIADLIFSDWSAADDMVSKEVLGAAWRIYNAGYRKSPQTEHEGTKK